jgi:hypothetical protein
LDTVEEGDVRPEETLDEDFLVLLAENCWGDSLASSGDGFTKALLREGRGLDVFADKPLLSLNMLDLTGSVSARLEGVARMTDCRFTGPRLCLPPVFTGLAGPSVVWEAVFDAELTLEENDIIETRDGVRLTVEVGVPPSSRPFW